MIAKKAKHFLASSRGVIEGYSSQFLDRNSPETYNRWFSIWVASFTHGYQRKPLHFSKTTCQRTFYLSTPQTSNLNLLWSSYWLGSLWIFHDQLLYSTLFSKYDWKTRCCWNGLQQWRLLVCKMLWKRSKFLIWAHHPAFLLKLYHCYTWCICK